MVESVNNIYQINTYGTILVASSCTQTSVIHTAHYEWHENTKNVLFGKEAEDNRSFIQDVSDALIVRCDLGSCGISISTNSKTKTLRLKMKA